MAHLKTIVEVCAGSVDVAVAAEEAGADRIELNLALELDGLTPSIGLVQEVLGSLTIPVIAMARPRAGDFCYSESEWRVLRRDVERMLEAGVAGIAFGCLDGRGHLQARRVAEIRKQVARSELVFHRAFDDCVEEDAIERMADLGIDRVMTSGGEPSALAGAIRIGESVRRSGGSVGVLPASQIGAGNVAELLRLTGCQQVHGTFGTRNAESYGAMVGQIRGLISAVE